MTDIDFSNIVDEDFAPAWIPQNEGDKIIGKVINLGIAFGDYGEYPTITIHSEEDDTDKSVHCFRAVLRQKIEELEPKPGERIAIVWKGKQKTRDGKYEFYKYIVKIEGREVDIWKKLREGGKKQGIPPEVVQADSSSDDEDAPF